MDQYLLKKIASDFSQSDYDLVVSMLKTVKLRHVMADSQANLDKTWLSILQLSKGDLNKLGDLVDAAKDDFRDVIYWATLEKNTET